MNLAEIKLTRRQFIWGGIAFAGSVLVGKYLAELFSDYGNLEPGPELLDALEAIRAFEKAIGQEPLSFETATLYLPLLESFISQRIEPSITKSSLVDHTFIIRDPGQSNAAVQLICDYPTLDRSVADTIIRKALLHRNKAGFILEEGIILNLTEINRLAGLEFDRLPPTLSCKKGTPASTLRMAFVHEFFHDQTLTQPQLLEEDLTELALRLISNGNSVERNQLVSAQRAALAIVIDYLDMQQEQQQIELTAFNEFATDYLTVRSFLQNGLSYRQSAYSSPSSIANFQRVLRQSGISDNHFYLLYKQSAIKVFLLKVAAAAKNTEFTNSQEMLHFTFSRTVGVPKLPMPWKLYSPYFADIDTGNYLYGLAAPGSGLEEKPGSGCITFSIRSGRDIMTGSNSESNSEEESNK